MSTTIYNNNYYKSTTNIDSQSTEEQEAISSLSTEIISITSKLNNLNADEYYGVARPLHTVK